MNVSETGPAAPFWSRVRATFIAPRELPDLIRPSLPWLDVLLISTAIAIASIATVPDEYFVEAMSDPVSRRGEPVELVSSPESIARWGRGMGMMATLATHPVVAVVIAGALTLVFSFLLRGSGTFRDHLSLVCHLLLIPAVGTVLTMVVRVTTSATSLSGLLPVGEPASYPMALLLAIDPFVIWMLIALAIAIHRRDTRPSSLRVSALLLASYLILIGASTAVLHRDLLG